MNKDQEKIALDDLVIGNCYEIAARNLHIGVWDGEAFHGIRTKFGDTFMDREIHWDLDNNFGTAVAVRELT